MFATSPNPAASGTTNVIIIATAVTMTVLLGTWIMVSLRRNRRLADPMGGLTRTESSLHRSHGIALVVVLVVSMGLAIGTVVSSTVRDALSSVGENSRTLTLAAIPLALGYGRWVSKRISAAIAERASLTR